MFGKILLATDGSQSSLKAARVAIEMARAYNAELIVVHVVDDAILEEVAHAFGKTVEEAAQVLEENGHKYMQEVERMAKEQWVKTDLEMPHGHPHEALLKVAEDKKVALIVMGKIGRRGPRRVLMGSVTERVVDLAEVPVLVVK
ncbi:MAG TPA: universal stress protein [Candidatus Binataceae bacterium]|nr:universal stress protein [Candidatus Binataceae bacterium]